MRIYLLVFATLIFCGCTSKTTTNPDNENVQPVELTIVNETPVRATVEIVNQTGHSLEPGDSVIYTIPSNFNAVIVSGTFAAYFSSLQSVGTIVSYCDTLQVNNLSRYRHKLQLKPKYCCFTLKNRSLYAIDQVKVNYNLGHETTINSTYPNDGVERAVGIYDTSYAKAVYVHFVTSLGRSSTWAVRVDYLFPNTANQRIRLDADSTGRSLRVVCINTVPYPVSCTIGSNSTVTIPTGDSIWYQYSENPTTVQLSASCRVLGWNDAPLGNTITWNQNLYVADAGSVYRCRLSVSTAYFLLKFNNTSSDTFTKFGMNVQRYDSVEVAIDVPPDGVTRLLGFYTAYTGTAISGTSGSTTQVYHLWRNGTEFTLPNTTNQVLTITASSDRRITVASGRQYDSSIVEIVSDGVEPSANHRESSSR